MNFYSVKERNYTIFKTNETDIYGLSIMYVFEKHFLIFSIDNWYLQV